MSSAARKPVDEQPTPEPASAETSCTDPFLAALDRAPIGEPWTPEQRAELDQQIEDIRAGRAVLVPHEEVVAWLEANKTTWDEHAEEE